MVRLFSLHYAPSISCEFDVIRIAVRSVSLCVWFLCCTLWRNWGIFVQWSRCIFVTPDAVFNPCLITPTCCLARLYLFIVFIHPFIHLFIHSFVQLRPFRAVLLEIRREAGSDPDKHLLFGMAMDTFAVSCLRSKENQKFVKKCYDFCPW